jgi:RNA polymerase sigma-70 factor (ECF subfamily)
MTEDDVLAAEFERHRMHLRAVAYRMLGSMSEAEDAVQESWLRLSRAGDAGIGNLGGWLTTVVARVALDMLRTRRSRREDYPGDWAPEPLVTEPDAAQSPEQQALLADAVGLALLVVLETLSPPERLAFVLHDMFAVPFDEIAPIVERTPAATRQLASRARRRVRGAAPQPDADLATQRKLVDAFLDASRGGDFDALVALLDPHVVLRTQVAGRARPPVVEAEPVARAMFSYRRFVRFGRPAIVNGAAGIAVGRPGAEPAVVIGFTMAGGLIGAVDVVVDQQRLGALLADA